MNRFLLLKNFICGNKISILKIFRGVVVTALIWVTLILSFDMDVYARDDEVFFAEVLTKSKIREGASKEDAALASVPEGAIIIIIDDDGSEFINIKYGECKGYIYRGCISIRKTHTLDEYNEQFIGATNSGEAKADNKKSSGSVDGNMTTRERARVANNVRNRGAERDDNTTRGIGTNTDINSNTEEYQAIRRDNALDATKNSIAAYTNELAEKSPAYKSSKLNIADIRNASRGGALTLGGGDAGNTEVKEKELEYIEGRVTTNLKLRSGPSTSSKRITTVPDGGNVKVFDKGENGFFHIEYNGQEGYAYSKCIKCDETQLSEAATEKSEGYSEVGSGGLSARRNSAVLFMMGRDNNGGKTANSAGKVKTGDLTAKKESEANSRLSKNVAYEISAKANMRIMPDKESDKITTLPVGAEVVAMGKTQGKYTLVQYNGVEGYVLEELVTEQSVKEINTGEAVLFTITAYCPCEKCCGKFSCEVTGGEPHTSIGTVPVEGRTVAVDPNVIPYGTKITIEGLGTFVAEDCGGGVDGTHIDVYFNTHEDAVNFGVKRLYVQIEQE